MTNKNLFLVLLFVTISSRAVKAEELSIRTDIYCPIACQPGENPGLIPEIVIQTMTKHNVKVEYSLLNWARSVEDTRAGKFNAIIGAAKSDAPDFIFPEVAQAKVKFELFGLKDKPWTYKGSFSGKKIGVVNGYAYDPTVAKLIDSKAPEFVIVSGEAGLDSLVSMLKAGRIDFLYENSGVFQNWLDQHQAKFSDFSSAGAPAQDAQELFIAFGPKFKDAKKYAKWISEETKAMKANGQLETLKKKYKLKF